MDNSGGADKENIQCGLEGWSILFYLDYGTCRVEQIWSMVLVNCHRPQSWWLLTANRMSNPFFQFAPFFRTQHDDDNGHDDDDLEGNGWVDDMLLHQVQARDSMPLVAPATKTDKIYSVGSFHSFTLQDVNYRLSSDSIILFSLPR